MDERTLTGTKLPPDPNEADIAMMEEESAIALGQRILDMRKEADSISIRIERQQTNATRFALDRVTDATDGAETKIQIEVAIGSKRGGAVTDRADEEGLRRAVADAEGYARVFRGPTGGDQIIEAHDPVETTNIWFPGNDASAVPEGRADAVEKMLTVARSSSGIQSAGYVAFMSSAKLMMNSTGFYRYARMTDTECSMTARTVKGLGSGWSGRNRRNWSTIDPGEVASQAVKWARDMQEPEVFEPGRYEVLLSPTAMGQLLYWFTFTQLDASMAAAGQSVFSKKPSGNKWGMQVLDNRLTILSDPNDPDGGYPGWDWGMGLPRKREVWIDKGFLRQFVWMPPTFARSAGHQTLPGPSGVRMRGDRQSSLSDMLSSMRKGFYVNRFSNLTMVDKRSCLVSGVTRDGLLYIENGKVKKAAKNMRFMDSMMFFLNAMEGVGPEESISIGWSSSSDPKPQIIAPPVLVRDFTFTALVDAI